MLGWVSPRLGIQFELEGLELGLYYPDGRCFLTYVELNQQREEAEIRAKVEAEARIEAEIRAEKAETRASEAENRARELEAKLKQAGLF